MIEIMETQLTQFIVELREISMISFTLVLSPHNFVFELYL